MKIEQREIAKIQKVYIANDGTECSSKVKLIEYELEFAEDSQYVYVLHQRGQRYDGLEIYSTEALAIKARGNATDMTIKSILLDKRHKVNALHEEIQRLEDE